MLKYFNLIAINLFLNLSVSFAGENQAFYVKISSENIVLKSAEAIFVISKDDATQCFKINNSIGIIPYYQYMADEKKHVYLKGVCLKHIKSSINKNGIKEISLIFQAELNFQLELTLSIKKNLPALFIKSFLRNISSRPQNNILFEWFSNNKFTGYIARDDKNYPMPERIDVDYSPGMPSRAGWTTIGTSRNDRWIMLLSQNHTTKELGIVSKKPVSFGMREDRLIYWGGVEGVVEEGESLSYDYVLVPDVTIDNFRNIFLNITED